MSIQEDYRQDAKNALHLAQEAMRRGDQKEARRWAAQAARLSPHLELPWLILAAVSDPQASIVYFNKVLEINPVSEHARRGLQWAQKQQRLTEVRSTTPLEDTSRIKPIIKDRQSNSASMISLQKPSVKAGSWSLNPTLFRYIFKTFFSGFAALFLFTMLVFFGVQVILPGDFASQYVLSLGHQGTQQLRENLGLNMPVWQQYLTWLMHTLQGDFGISYSAFGDEIPVLSIILNILPSTLFAYGLGTILAFLLGHSLGKEIAFHKGATPASVFIPLGIFLYTSFPPWLVFLIMYLIRNLIYKGFWAPALMIRNIPAGYPPELLVTMLGTFTVLVGFFWGISILIQRRAKVSFTSPLIIFFASILWVGSWYLLGIHEQALQVIKDAAIPILSFTLLSFGEILLITRTTMRETMYEEYILLAKAKGLPPEQVRDRHAARTALLPITSRMAISIPYLLSGMVMIESALGWPGIGTTLFYAVGMQNTPLMMGALVFNGILILLIRIGLDILLSLLDPRIRTSGQGVGNL